jgi:hypothetical protein
VAGRGGNPIDFRKIDFKARGENTYLQIRADTIPGEGTMSF